MYNNLGLYYKEISNPPKAFESWNLALQSFDKIEDRFGKSDTYHLMGELYFDQQDYSNAILYAQRASDLSKQLNVLEGTALAEKLLSDVYEKLNNPNQAFILHLS